MRCIAGGNSPVGLAAEEAEKVNPDLVIRGENGKVMGVRYEAVNAMLLNEFLKEHRKVVELEKNQCADCDGREVERPAATD